MAAGSKLEVRLPDGRTSRLVDLDPWQLLNLDSDEALKLPARCYKLGISTTDFDDAVGNLSLQTLGVSKFNRDCLGGFPNDPVVLVSGTKHYSWPKATALLGLGSASLINLTVDLDARMDTGAGFDDAVGLFAKGIGRHRRTVQRWLAGEYEIDPPMAAYIRSLKPNARPV